MTLPSWDDVLNMPLALIPSATEKADAPRINGCRTLGYFFPIRGLMLLYTSSMSAMLFQKGSGPWAKGL